MENHQLSMVMEKKAGTLYLLKMLLMQIVKLPNLKKQETLTLFAEGK